MKKVICYILALVVTFGLTACNQGTGLDVDYLAGKLADALATGRQVTSTSMKNQPTTTAGQAKPTSESATSASTEPSQPEPTRLPDEYWQEQLAGWWVDMMDYTEPVEYPELFYFATEGYVFVNPDDYDAFTEYGLEPDFYYNWYIENGEAFFLDYAGFAGEDPLVCGLEIDDAGSLFIHWPDGTYRYLEHASSSWASRILLASSYAYLAEGASLGLIKLDKSADPVDGLVSVLIDDKYLVGIDDTELIEQFGLQDADFSNDYELADDDAQYYPYLLITEDDFTSYRLLDYSDDYFITDKPVDFDQFSQKLAEHGEEGFLVWYSLLPDQEHLVAAIVEIYLP